MLAFKLNPRINRPEEPGDLASEEVALESMEAKLSLRLEEMQHSEGAALQALQEQRQELTSLLRSPVGGMAMEVLARFASHLPPQPSSETTPERKRADEARRLALEARRVAIQAEEQALSRREEALAKLEETSALMRQATAAVHARTLELSQRKSVEQIRRLAEAAAPRGRAAREPALAQTIQKAKAPCANRRKTQRVTMQTEVDLSSDSNFYAGFSTDLSDGGIFVATCQYLPTGTEVDLAFTLPGAQRIQAKGVVRWSREFNDATPEVFPGLGVELMEMSPQSRHAIHAFTSQREPLFWA